MVGKALEGLPLGSFTPTLSCPVNPHAPSTDSTLAAALARPACGQPNDHRSCSHPGLCLAQHEWPRSLRCPSRPASFACWRAPAGLRVGAAGHGTSKGGAMTQWPSPDSTDACGPLWLLRKAGGCAPHLTCGRGPDHHDLLVHLFAQGAAGVLVQHAHAQRALGAHLRQQAEGARTITSKQTCKCTHCTHALSEGTHALSASCARHLFCTLAWTIWNCKP